MKSSFLQGSKHEVIKLVLLIMKAVDYEVCPCVHSPSIPCDDSKCIGTFNTSGVCDVVEFIGIDLQLVAYRMLAA